MPNINKNKALKAEMFNKFKKIKIEAFGKNWNWYALIGLCNIAIPFVLIAIGTAKINSYLAAILMSTTPLSGSILAHLFTKNEKLMKVLVSNLNSDLNFFISNNKTNGVIAKKPMKNLTALNVNGPMLSMPVS